jgi:hypothetical protein
MLLRGSRTIMLLLFVLTNIRALSQDYFLKMDKANPVLYLMNKEGNIKLDSIEHTSSLEGFSFGISGNKVFTISEMIGSNHRSLFYLNYYDIKSNRFFPIGYVGIHEDDKKVDAGLAVKIKDSVLILSYSFADKQINKSYPLNTQLLNSFKTNYDLFRKEVIETEGIVLVRKAPPRL